MVDENGPPSFPHLLAALDTFQARVSDDLGSRAAELGVRLRGSHGRILQLLAPEGTRPSRLAEGWISKQAVGQRVQELVRAGLVVLEPDPDDGRATLARRTPAGDDLATRATAMALDVERELAAEVGDDRWRTFREVLDELAWPRAPALLVEQQRRAARAADPGRASG